MFCQIQMGLIGVQMNSVIQYIISLTSLQILWHTFGCYYLVQFLRLILSIVWNLIKELIPLNDILCKYSHPESKSGDCWAVVTGASDGIGLGFCQVLTQQGFDICLISRNQQKLDKTVQDLKKYRQEQHKCRKFMTIQFDFQDSSNQQKFKLMIDKVKQLSIGILVNNVGTNEIIQYEKLSYDQIKKIIDVNCTSMSAMTLQLIKLFKNRKGKSAIINLSSFAGQNPVPFISLYAATKAMNTFFTEALSLQYPHIDILSVRPMFVQSPLSRKLKGFNIPDRRQCALACLKQLRWQYQTNGYLLHRIFAKIYQLFIPNFLHRIMSKLIIKKELPSY